MRDYEVSLFDVTGKIERQKIIRESGKINTDVINNGVYILKLSKGKSVYTTKITKGRRD